MKIREFIGEYDYPCWCSATRAKLYCFQLGSRRNFAAVECSECSTQRLLPRVLAGQESAVELYKVTIISAPNPSQHVALEQKVLRRMQAVGFQFREGMSVLDVGCGDGLLLNAICRDYKCIGLGVDVDQRRIQYAKENRFSAEFRCGLFDAREIKKRFEVVIASAILEHVVDPVGFLRALKEGLVEGGYVYILVPNARSLSYSVLKSWWRELLSVGEHIYLFTPESLEECAAKAGLKLIDYNSDFDFVSFGVLFKNRVSLPFKLWGIYRECVKRLSSIFSGRARGDILFARLGANEN